MQYNPTEREYDLDKEVLMYTVLYSPPLELFGSVLRGQVFKTDLLFRMKSWSMSKDQMVVLQQAKKTSCTKT